MASPSQKDLACSTPPIWQGRARGGESATILGRNPDGTFQVSLNGVEKTFTEPNLAGMLNMRKGPLYEMLGQATQQHLAQPRTTSTSTPPIWQGRAAHGENAAILGRNPDGTFQVSLNGVEKTFKEPQVAAMTSLKKGPLYEMLGQATKGRLAGSQGPNQEFNDSSARLQDSDPTTLQPVMDQVTQSLESVLPGVMGRDAHLLVSPENLLNSDYARNRRPPFTADEIAAIRDSEGFHDPRTGQSFVFASQVRPKPGESHAQAVMRVALHECLGHGGVNRLLTGNPKAQQQFDFLVGKIQELDPQGFQALATEPAYAHLQGDPRALALEWLAQKSETRPDLLRKPNVLTHLRNLLGQAINSLQVKLGLRAETGADLDRRVDIFLHRARQAAVRGGASNSAQGLQFKKDSIQPVNAKPVAKMAVTAKPGTASTQTTVGHSFAGARERAALEKMLAGFGGPAGPLMQQVQKIAADTRRHGPEVAESILQSLVAAQQNPVLKTARARDVVLRPLQNSAQFNECVLGLATAVKSGLTPAEIADVLTNHHRILSPHYTAENLLLDTENLGPIPGLSDLWRMLKTDSAQAKGFRYELEGAAAINRGAMGKKIIVTELSKRISVTLDGSETKTDIDVVIRKGRDTIVYNQLKRSAKALGYGERGLEATKLWVSKALAGLAKHKSHKVVYVVPPGVNIPPRIEAWLKSVQIDSVRIHHAE